jgi:hypothetical protein
MLWGSLGRALPRALPRAFLKNSKGILRVFEEFSKRLLRKTKVPGAFQALKAPTAWLSLDIS